jgi:hypothetical protein
MSRQYRHIHTKQNLYRNDGDSVESKTQPVTRSHFSRVEILMEIPDTLLPAEHYAPHFGVSEKEVEEYGKVVVGDTTTAHFGLSAEALAKLEELK